MALLYTARKIVQYARNTPLVINKIYAELTALDTRINAMDGAGEIELSQFEASTEGKVIVYDAAGVAQDVAMSGDVTIAANGATTVGASKITAAKMAVFQSTEQIGDGNPQNVAHGLGVSPTIVFVELTSVGTDGATVTYTKGTTNVVVTATTGAKYVVHAIA